MTRMMPRGINMNIQEAKKQIKRSVMIYLTKDEYGAYVIPVEKQRPIFMIGAPGIGKTAIMEQIAEELNISLVSYSMTHHTRQSALGLPLIVHKEFKGQTYEVTEYTMSEIIVSIYDTIERTGCDEGILFLDEINCVSETLGPSMLQFLQYKTFGNHKIPNGWVIVTAGNPPEYNRSVREFDMATLDRLKVMDVSPDYDAWKFYARKSGVHEAVLTFLDIKKDDFYIADREKGAGYVTARGWEDLSEAIKLYEQKDFPVDETLISQYISVPRVAREFATYYALYSKYRSDYKIKDILKGCESAEIRDRAGRAGFDERLTITGLMLEYVQPEIRRNILEEESLRALLPKLREMKQAVKQGGLVHDLLDTVKDYFEKRMKTAEAAGKISFEERSINNYSLSFIRKCFDLLDVSNADSEEGRFAEVSREYQRRVESMKASVPVIQNELNNMFVFLERVFGDDNEILVAVTELTVTYASARFLSEHGCDGYYRHNRRLMVFERNQELMEEIEELDRKRNEKHSS